MLRKVLKWLPLVAASTMAFGLYAASDASNDASAAGSLLPKQISQQGQGGLPNKSMGGGNSCNPCKPIKPCCVPMQVVPLPPCEPPCQDPCCPQRTVYNHNINPTARCTCDNNDLYITLDFLWWISNEPETPFAFVSTNTASFASSNNLAVPQQGYNANVKYKWDPGFRVGIGWDTGYDGWEVFADWLWYYSATSSSVSANLVPGSSSNNGNSTVSQGVHYPAIFWYGLNGSGSGQQVSYDAPLASATGKYRILVNMFDFLIARSYYISCGLAMKPYIGATGGWIDRRLRTSFGDGVPNTTSVSGTVPFLLADSTYASKANYWGVGPRAGLDGFWKLGMGFEFIGKMSTALLYGNTFNNYETITSAGITSVYGAGANNSIFNITNNKHNWRIVPNLQLYLGLGWGDCFSCGQYYFGINAGWEADFFWNLPNFVNPTSLLQSSTAAHTVDLAGLTVDVRFDF